MYGTLTREAATHPPRDDCDAQQHDSAWAHRRFRCRCPLARQAARKARARYPLRKPVPGNFPRGRARKDATVDPARVADATAGAVVDLNPRELAAALAAVDVRRGSTWVKSAAQIARRIGCSERTVQRHRRARLRDAAQHPAGVAA
jgi:hypothetical protein